MARKPKIIKIEDSFENVAKCVASDVKKKKGNKNNKKKIISS